jgi:transcription termination factor NusB
MNVSRSKVRQGTLSYLYAYLTNGSQPLESSVFWSIAQEKEVDSLRTARAKALLHVCRATADSARLLVERVQKLENMMHADLTAAGLWEDVQRYATQSSNFDAAVKALQYCVADKRRDTTDQLVLCAGDVMRLAKAVLGLGRELLPKFADFPAYRPLLDGVASVVNRRARMLETCTQLEDLKSLSGNKEYAGLVRLNQDMVELRPAVESLAKAVIAHIPLMEPRLEALLANYSLERLDLVDKSILYIALYELTVNGLDVPIVVSEATALANEFSGSRSAQFIHGVVAAAAKN